MTINSDTLAAIRDSLRHGQPIPEATVEALLVEIETCWRELDAFQDATDLYRGDDDECDE